VLCADALVWRGPAFREVLLVQRAHEPNQGKWALPGGKVGFGEEPLSAAMRELMEETGIWAQPRQANPFAFVRDVVADDRIHYIAAYEFTGPRGKLTRSDESLDVAWWPVTALPENITDVHYTIISTARMERYS
jgi:8-oxo-dGTP diphosphatase